MMGINVLFNIITEVQLVYEMSRIDCGEFFINSPVPAKPALFINTPISCLSLNDFNYLQIFLISETLLKSPITISICEFGNFYLKKLTLLSIFYLFLPIRMTFIFNLSNSFTKAHPMPSVNPVMAIQQSPYFYLRSSADDLVLFKVCLM